MKIHQKAQNYVERFLYLCLALIFVISAVYGYFIYQLVITNQQHLSEICKSANELRAAEQNLWEYILTLPPTRILTEEEQARQDKTIIQFKKVLSQNFAQKECLE